MSLVKFANGRKGTTISPFDGVFESMFDTDSFISDRFVSRVPAVNIAESENDSQIELAVPGMKKDDFKINLDKNLLSISSEVKSESSDTNESKNYNRREYTYSSFVRSFTLPESSDLSNINAEYTDGILKISVSKKEEAKLPAREISIS